jgi:hypothetical protein
LSFSQDLLLLVDGEVRRVAVALHALLQPFHAVYPADVLVFHANALAIRRLQMLQDRCQRGFADAQFRARLENCAQVRIRKPKIGKVQGGHVGTPLTYGIGVRKEVPALAIAVDQGDHLEFLGHILMAAFSGHSIGGRRLAGKLGILGTSQIKSLEEPRPIGRYGTGVRFVLLIHRIDGGGVDIAEERVFVHGWAENTGPQR